MISLDNGKISPKQFLFTIACYIQASAMLTSFFVSITRQDSWLAVLLGFAGCIPFILIYIGLMNQFPGMNLIQISRKVYGPVVGSILSAFYVWFFLTLTSLNLRDLGDFIHQTIMPETPSIVILSVFLLVCVWAVRNGIQVVTRYSTLFALFSILVIGLTTLLTSNLMDFDHFLPVLRLPLKSYIQGTHIVSTIPFGEIMVFLMISPNIALKEKKPGRYYLGGFALGGLSLLAVVVRDLAVLGDSLFLFTLPSFETQRMASLTESISRLEILFAVVLIIFLFAKITLLYYITVQALTHLLGLNAYKTLVLPLGIWIMVYAFLSYESTMQHAESAARVVPFVWSLFEFVLPLITLILAKVLKKKPEEVN